jgi:hypothetical protein
LAAAISQGGRIEKHRLQMVCAVSPNFNATHLSGQIQMAGPEDVRRIALSFNGAIDESASDRLAFAVSGKKGFAWTWLERVHPNKPRVPRLEVLAVRCPLGRKEILLEAAADIYFEDEHYTGYPAILVRLGVIPDDELIALMKDAWRL